MSKAPDDETAPIRYFGLPILRHLVGLQPAPGTKLAEWRQAPGNRISDENVVEQLPSRVHEQDQPGWMIDPDVLSLDVIAGFSVRLRDHVRSLRAENAALKSGYQSAMEGITGHCETIMVLKNQIARLEAERDAHVTAMADDGPKADYHGPDDPAHRAVHDVAEHLLNGRVTNAKARAGLRDALDKADRPAEGRAKSDQSLGRAIRLEGPGYRYDPVTNRTYGMPVDANSLRVQPSATPASAKPPAAPKPPIPATALNPKGSKPGLFVP